METKDTAAASPAQDPKKEPFKVDSKQISSHEVQEIALEDFSHLLMTKIG